MQQVGGTSLQDVDCLDLPGLGHIACITEQLLLREGKKYRLQIAFCAGCSTGPRCTASDRGLNLLWLGAQRLDCEQSRLAALPVA